MLATNDNKVLNLMDNGRLLGVVKYNPDFDYRQKTIRPFLRTRLRLVEKVGKVNYELLDQFITKSFTDFYQRMMGLTDSIERNQKIQQYQELYFLWQRVGQAKQTNDAQLNSYYD